MEFVVTTQVLENYGAHAEDGKYSSGNAYWKFKHGSDYIVKDVERDADAMAFVQALLHKDGNNLGWKEFPIDVKPKREWMHDINKLDEEYKAFKLQVAREVSPKRHV